MWITPNSAPSGPKLPFPKFQSHVSTTEEIGFSKFYLYRYLKNQNVSNRIHHVTICPTLSPPVPVFLRGFLTSVHGTIILPNMKTQNLRFVYMTFLSHFPCEIYLAKWTHSSLTSTPTTHSGIHDFTSLAPIIAVINQFISWLLIKYLTCLLD